MVRVIGDGGAAFERARQRRLREQQKGADILKPLELRRKNDDVDAKLKEGTYNRNEDPNDGVWGGGRGGKGGKSGKGGRKGGGLSLAKMVEMDNQ